MSEVNRRLGPIVLAPGYTPLNAITYLYAAFITIGLLAFVSFIQAYLLNVNLHLPEAVQGRTVSQLNIANEIIALLLVAPCGALADKIGRRAVYAAGFLWVGVGFIAYPYASTLPQLYAAALFFSVGVAAIGTMLATVLADTPREDSRGRLVGAAGFCQGLGAMLFVLILGKVPTWLARGGMSDLQAGRVTLAIAGALCIASAVIVYAGLRKGTPREHAADTPLLQILRDGFVAARSNPRIWFAYMLQFVSFGDRVVLGTFFTLRLQQEWLARGVSMTEATDKARVPYIIALATGLVTAVVFGVLLDRLDRLRSGIVAMGLASVAYFCAGFIDDPTMKSVVVPASILLGVGQIAAIISSQTMLGQEAPAASRGAVFGFAGICASLGILFTNAAGGWLFDLVSKGGPFFLLAGVNFMILLFGLWLQYRDKA